MPLQQDVIVGGEGLEFFEAFLNLEKSLVNIGNGYWEDLLQKSHPDLSISHYQENALPSLSGNNEVSLRITDTFALLYPFWPFLNEFPTRQCSGRLASAPSFGTRSDILDLPSIRTLNEAVERILGNWRQISLMLFNPSGKILGRLAREECLFDEGA